MNQHAGSEVVAYPVTICCMIKMSVCKQEPVNMVNTHPLKIPEKARPVGCNTGINQHSTPTGGKQVNVRTATRHPDQRMPFGKVDEVHLFYFNQSTVLQHHAFGTKTDKKKNTETFHHRKSEKKQRPDSGNHRALPHFE